MKNNHVENIVIQKNENNISKVADIILDIESMLHKDYKHSLDAFDLKIIKRCKFELSQLFKELGLFNIKIQQDEINHSENGLIKPIHHLPRLTLNFKPQSLKEDDNDNLIKENEKAETIINKINNLIRNSSLKNINIVKQSYTEKEDGLLITINIEDLHISEILKNIELVINETFNLSLDELNISQQFSNIMSIEWKNPFYLVNKKNDVNKNIQISIFHIDSYTPCYSLNTILKSIYKQIEIFQNSNEQNLTLSYESINGSFVSVFLNKEET